MKKWVLILTFLLLTSILIVSYLVWVRGLGIEPNIPSAKIIKTGSQSFNFFWEIKKEMSTARTEVGVALWNGKIYVAGGMDGMAGVSTKVEIYDPATDSWTTGPDLPAGRHHATVAQSGNSLYVIGGFSDIRGTPVNTVYRLKNGSSKWENISPIPNARGALGSAVIEGKIYIVGGVGPEGLTNELAAYDPQLDLWSIKTPAPSKRDHLAVASGNFKLYVGGGREQALDKNLATLEIYDPEKNTWEKGPDMPTPRGGVAGAFFRGMFIVAGGEQPQGTFNHVEAFNPTTNAWLALPELPTARHGLAVVSVNDSLFVIGGGKRPGLSVSGSNEVLRIFVK